MTKNQTIIITRTKITLTICHYYRDKLSGQLFNLA